MEKQRAVSFGQTAIHFVTAGDVQVGVILTGETGADEKGVLRFGDDSAHAAGGIEHLQSFGAGDVVTSVGIGGGAVTATKRTSGCFANSGNKDR